MRLAAEEINVDLSVYGNLFSCFTVLFILFLASFTDVLFCYIICLLFLIRS